jgi:heme-degrading monooxygenase HmoA
MPTVIHVLDSAFQRFRCDPGFKGLLCLEHDARREEVMIITLWEADSFAATTREADEARELIAYATHMGVASREYEVLGFVSGFAGVREVSLSL